MTHDALAMGVAPATPDEVDALSYTDFVGFVNQTNVPPGALSTVNQWAVHGFVDASSTVVEVACTTGFSLRELTGLTGCTGVGVDLSAASVERAVRNAADAGLAASIGYVCADATAFNPPGPFTHLLFGASLGFFSEPRRMLEHSLTWLGDAGHVLVSPFYVRAQIPESLLADARTVFGITPTTAGYKQVMAVYRGLDVAFEQRHEIEPETEAEIEQYCASTVVRGLEDLGIGDEAVREACFRRLRRIKQMSNELRPYQAYAVMVLRYSAGQYPHRYVELF